MLSPASLRPLNTYRDTIYLLETIPDISAYRTAHQFLSLYLKRRGLYSAKFGYLGGIHLSLMLNRVVKLLPSPAHSPAGKGKARIDSKYDDLSPASIVRSFFEYYAAFDWARDIVYDPWLNESTTKHARSAREPVYIQSIHIPTARLNVASSCTKLSAHTFTEEFLLAKAHVDSGEWDWCLRSRNDCVSDFLNEFGAFVRITLDFWDIDILGGDEVRVMMGSLESRITGLMVGLSKLDGLKGRVWPARFCEDEEEEEEAKTNDGREGEADYSQFRVYYLIGISASDEHGTDERKVLTGKVINAVRMFERTIKELKGFDQGHSWVEVELVSKKKINEMSLVIDDRDLGWKSNPALSSTSLQADAAISDAAEVSTNLHSAAKKGKTRKLRPAQDIISRIRWDPTLQSDDFLVGYEDRFLGVKEIELGRWKSEQTDLEFIPMHRIVWLRKKGPDGEIVWDREKRLDKICGSGN
jgi:uncharacterized protein (UPF0248 family)